jgi:hypothetical protein
MLWQQKLQIKTERHKEKFLLILKLISSDCVINYNTIWLMRENLKLCLVILFLFCCISKAIKKLITFEFSFLSRTENFSSPNVHNDARYFYFQKNWITYNAKGKKKVQTHFWHTIICRSQWVAVNFRPFFFSFTSLLKCVGCQIVVG